MGMPARRSEDCGLLEASSMSEIFVAGKNKPRPRSPARNTSQPVGCQESYDPPGPVRPHSAHGDTMVVEGRSALPHDAGGERGPTLYSRQQVVGDPDGARAIHETRAGSSTQINLSAGEWVRNRPHSGTVHAIRVDSLSVTAQLTAGPFFGATLTASSYDSRRRVTMAKKSKSKKAASGKGQGHSQDTMRREKESPGR